MIELATPHLVAHAQVPISKVILAGGEAPDPLWERGFRERLGATPVDIFVEPAFNYFSEQRLRPATLTRRIQVRMAELLDTYNTSGSLVWAHNLGIARNLIVTRELVRACNRRNRSLIAHHHDWWFENRWLRWPEMRRSGFDTVRSAATTIFASANCMRHVAINHADVDVLARHFEDRTGWLPNLTEPPPATAPSRIRKAADWLRKTTGDREPVIWIVPCRLLRRKNLAEAILLTRWLRPEAWLITTGGASSKDEIAYARRLQTAADQNRWNVRLGVLDSGEQDKPSVPDLLKASEVVLLTSMQEGFGLPYLEAAAARKPLIARAIPNIAPDLNRFGFRFANLYDEIRVDRSLFNFKRERERQGRMFARWKDKLPRTARQWTGTPALLGPESDLEAVPFSRLTLTAQLEVLSKPVEQSWGLCSKLNPFLIEWNASARARRLEPAEWPKSADQWLSGTAYGRRFWSLATLPGGSPVSASKSIAVQEDFMRQRLGASYLFPLLWARES